MKINYVFILSSTENDSIFPYQGYPLSMLNQSTLKKFRSIVLHAPTSIKEIFLSHNELLSYRKNISRSIIFLSASELTQNHLSPEVSFPALVFSSDNYDENQNIIDKFIIKPLCIGESLNCDISFNSVNSIFSLDQCLFKYYNRVIKYFKEKGKELKPNYDQLGIRDPSSYSSSIELYTHSATLPNSALIANLGFKYHDLPISFGLNEDIKLNQQEELINFKIKQLIECSINQYTEITGSKLECLIVYCPSIMLFYYEMNNFRWNSILKKIKSKPQRELIKGHLIRNKGYSVKLVSQDDIKDLTPFSIDNSEEELTYFNIYELRSLELFCTNWLIANLAISESIPAIRLPHSIMLQQNLLNRIETHSKKTGKKAEMDFAKAFNKYKYYLKTEIGDILINQISQVNELILCCDRPIEWVSIEQPIPLMISHQVFRIPMTPGSLFGRLSRHSKDIIIKKINLKKILVIRSFKETDSIKNVLHNVFEKSGLFSNTANISGFKKIGNKLNISILDVNSKNELVEALNNFEGEIIIFDCHGNHGGLDKPGWLQIGEDNVSVRELNNIVKIPSIVILSACLTHPIAGSEDSVSNGFLDSGALSVIGTFLPVNAEKSAKLISQLLLTINLFIDKMSLFSWKRLVSIFFRVSYFIESLQIMCDDLKLSEKNKYQAYTRFQNLIIEDKINFSYEFLKLMRDLYSIKNNDLNNFDDYIKIKLCFLDVMNYIHLGRPDRIWVMDETDQTLADEMEVAFKRMEL